MTLREKAIEALALLMVGRGNWLGYTRSEQIYRKEAATVAFDANHPRLVWKEGRGDAFVAGDYTVARVMDGSWMIWGDTGDTDDPIGNELNVAAAQAAAEDHYLTQRLAGTALWKAMEEMG